jgi:hypothetical protein
MSGPVTQILIHYSYTVSAGGGKAVIHLLTVLTHVNLLLFMSTLAVALLD